MKLLLLLFILLYLKIPSAQWKHFKALADKVETFDGSLKRVYTFSSLRHQNLRSNVGSLSLMTLSTLCETALSSRYIKMTRCKKCFERCHQTHLLLTLKHFLLTFHIFLFFFLKTFFEFFSSRLLFFLSQFWCFDLLLLPTCVQGEGRRKTYSDI